MTAPRIVTFGLYGDDELTFFQKLLAAKIDLFCDIRRRRGVRGSQYAFVNSIRLQTRLSELGIAYIHIKELAPTEEVREVQKRIDKSARTAKRQRDELSDEFVKAYHQACLADFSASDFLDALPGTPEIIGLFCVERAPAACHRSLVAAELANQLNLEVTHL